MEVYVVVNRQGQPENVFADYETALYAVEVMLDFSNDTYWQSKDYDVQREFLWKYIHCFELNCAKVVRPKSVPKNVDAEEN